MSHESEGHQLSLTFYLQQKIRETQSDNEPDVEHRAAREQMFELMGNLGPILRWHFICVEIADAEIATAQQAHPHLAEHLWNSFTYLWPSELLHIRNPKLYRAHAQEMLQRLIAGETKRRELESATAAELCCLFSAASLASPLNADAIAAYKTLFAQVFPDAPLVKEFTAYESYPGRADEIIRDLRQKYRQSRTMSS